MTTIALIALGGALGALARYGVNLGAVAAFGHAFPYGTMIVNVVGSFMIGVIIAKFSQMDGVSHDVKVFCVTGFLGAFTTFSTFSLDFVTLWQRGDLMQAALYMLISVIVSVGALIFGLWVMKGSAV